MGNKSSGLGGSKSKVLAQKVETSKKTGVLNLSNLQLRPTSSIWHNIDYSVLKLLDISGNKLGELPSEVYNMPNLK